MTKPNQQFTKPFNVDRRAAMFLLAGAAGVVALFSLKGPQGASASTPAESYPLMGIVRDFAPTHADFKASAVDGQPFSVGNVANKLGENGLPTYIGSGRAITVASRDSAGRGIMPAIAKALPITDFSISSNSRVVTKQASAARVTIVGAAIASGGTPIPVTMQVVAGSTTYSPFGAYNSPTTGNVNDNKNPRSFILPATVDANTTITINGRSWLRSSGSGTRDADFREVMAVSGSVTSNNVRALRNGDTPPTVAGFAGQVSAKGMLQPYINTSTNKVTLANNQVIYLFELGTTDTRSSAFDMQDLVVLVEFATDATYFTQPPAPTPTPTTSTACATINDTLATFGSPNAGGISSASSFAQWFTDVPGVNLAVRQSLLMTKDPVSGLFSYATTNFDPINGNLYGNNGAANNRGFTMVIDAECTYNRCGKQFLEFQGDGDVWAFVNGQLALDMGGLHPNASQIVDLDRFEITNGSKVRLQVFYAQRAANAANFNLRTNMILSTSSAVTPPPTAALYD